ncbi:MAG: hypothetical protein RLZZ384_1521, partial [Pseudomonadota bacterium]
ALDPRNPCARRSLDRDGILQKPFTHQQLQEAVQLALS